MIVRFIKYFNDKQEVKSGLYIFNKEEEFEELLKLMETAGYKISLWADSTYTKAQGLDAIRKEIEGI